MTALTDMSQTLRSCADALNDYADAQPNPFDPSLAQLRTTAVHIIIDASIIGQQELGAMTKEVSDAITGLRSQVNKAQSAVTTIDDVKVAVSIAAAVFSAAAAFATGNPLSASDKIVALTNTIASAISANTAG
jgi:hypothetical protein